MGRPRITLSIPEPKIYKSRSTKKRERKNRIHAHGYVYIIRNSMDKLVYIGSTYLPYMRRYEAHMSTSFNVWDTKPIYCHIRELGYRNFSISILDHKENITNAALRALEDVYIRKYKSVIYGLNMNYATGEYEFVSKGDPDKFDERCEHLSLRSVCKSCDIMDPPMSICKHNKIKHLCHKCYQCKICKVLCTPEHKALPSHIQRTIEAEQAPANKAEVVQMMEQLNIGIQ